MKYEFTGETKVCCDRTLHRIRSVSNFGKVENGDLGGWIEKKENLSHDGTAWVYDNAYVFGNAWVHGDAKVGDDANVFDNAWVFGNAKVYGKARIYGDANIYDYANIYGDANIFGNTRIHGDVLVYGYALVYGNARISRDTHYITIGPIGSRSGTTTFFRGRDLKIYVKCGCFHGNIDEFVEKVKQTHGDNKHAKAYMAAIALAKAWIDLTPEADKIKVMSNEELAKSFVKFYARSTEPYLVGLFDDEDIAKLERLVMEKLQGPAEGN